MVRAYSLFTTDMRFNVPTLTFILCADEEAAIARAVENLASSVFHTAVEIRERDDVVYRRVKSSNAMRRAADRRDRLSPDM